MYNPVHDAINPRANIKFGHEIISVLVNGNPTSTSHIEFHHVFVQIQNVA